MAAATGLFRVFVSILFSIVTLRYADAFVPTDNYLIDCGSETDTKVSNRFFLADKSDSTLLSTPKHITANSTCSNTVPFSTDDDSILYQTARIFDQKSTYNFPIKQQGRHFIRLYFHPFVFSPYNLFQASFDVSTANISLLSRFTATNSTVKEFSINVPTTTLAITFLPSPNSIAYISAIELVSVPDYLIKDGTAVSYNPRADFPGLASQAFETAYRVNMGGPMVNYANDSLWRTWVSDERFEIDPNSSKIKNILNVSAVTYSGNVAVSEDVAPRSVYGTAKEISSDGGEFSNRGGDYNLSWQFGVDVGYQYLVRLHFCDVRPTNGGSSLEKLVFDVSINSVVAIKDYDIGSVTAGVAGGADYRDVVTQVVSEGTIRVSIVPSNDSSGDVRDGLLNGLEIMKMNNSLGSLSGSAAVAPLKSGGSGKRFGGMVNGLSIVAGLVGLLLLG